VIIYAHPGTLLLESRKEDFSKAGMLRDGKSQNLPFSFEI
jgi:hypothetical protein